MPTLKAKNITAELQFKARGNPPAAHPDDAVGNFFPGLEFNFQNVWKRFFVGVELLEYGGRIIAVDPAAIQASGGTDQTADGIGLGDLLPCILVQIDHAGKTLEMTEQMQGPLADENVARDVVALEWSNTLAAIHAAAGMTPDLTVDCHVQSGNPRFDPNRRFGPFKLKVRRLLEAGSALISREASLPGEITESLCSPWQTDYIGCACYYWASNRPDYVNITDAGDGDTAGHNWLNTARINRSDGKPLYTLQGQNLLRHEDVMQDWEKKFQFIVGGKDYPL